MPRNMGEGDRSVGVRENMFSYLTELDKGVNGRLDRANTRTGIPTLPLYDSTNFPDEAIYGQVVRDKNDYSSMWVYGEDDEWHKIEGGAGVSGDAPYVSVSGTGAVSGGSPQFPQYYNVITPALGYDTDLFGIVSFPTFPNGLLIKQKGLFYCRQVMRWAYNWGVVGVQFYVYPSLGATTIEPPGYQGIVEDRRSVYFNEGVAFGGGSFDLVKDMMIGIDNVGSGGILLGTETSTDGITNQGSVQFHQFVQRVSSSPFADQH